MSVFSASVYSSTVYKTDGIPDAVKTQGGALQNQWYYNGWAEEKKDKAEELTDKYIETLETIDLQENQSVSTPIFQQQKKAIVSNLVRQINALDIFNSAEIQAAIRQAEYDYYMNLAYLREQDDEAALMLLLN